MRQDLITFEGLEEKARAAREAGKRLVGLPYNPRMKSNGTTDDDLRAECIRFALKEEK